MDVRNSVVEKYLSTHTQLLAQNLLHKKSTMIVSDGTKFDFFFEYIFTGESRRRLFKRYSEDYIFVSIGSVENFGEVVFQKLRTEYDFKGSEDFEKLYDWLDRNEKIIVAYSDVEDLESRRMIYSYKYFGGDRLLFCFRSNDVYFQTSDLIKIEFPKNLHKLVIYDRLAEIGIHLAEEEVARITQLSSNDIKDVDKLIIRYLYDSREIQTTKSEVDQPIEEETVNIESVQASVSELIEFSNEPDLSIMLTKREQSIYSELKIKGFLSRDEIAEIVWGDEAAIRANPDALDQIISRLRRKFVAAGYDKKYISSRKGEGVVLVRE